MSIYKGKKGEDIACTVLKRLGFTVIDRNYLTRHGEIDIIAVRKSRIHIIEVKSSFGEYNPAENFHKRKLRRLLKAVRIYCYKKGISPDNISIDLLLVNTQKRVCNFIANVNQYFH